MNTKPSVRRLAAGAFILALAVTAFVLRPANRAGSEITETAESAAETAAVTALPRLLDLGADKCVPCKMMAPILADLKTELAGTLTVDFIDVWQDPPAAEPYGIRVIPTQIFFAADGRELFRHEGFFGRDEILAKWRELGVDLPAQDL